MFAMKKKRFEVHKQGVWNVTFLSYLEFAHYSWTSEKNAFMTEDKGCRGYKVQILIRVFHIFLG